MKSATLVAVGDLQLGDSVICVGYGFRSRVPGPEALLEVFSRIRSHWSDADIVFGNLECQLSDLGKDEGSLASAQMRATPGYATALKAAGFTVMNVANNHSVQHGIAAFEESVASLRAQGIAVCGVRGAGPMTTEPAIVTAKSGLRVGFLGYSLRPRQYGTGSSADTPPYAEGTESGITADVAALRPQVDQVVVSLHWGEEFVQQPAAREVALAHAIVEAGASLVLGHHPHVTRPVERYRDAVIVYSMGNFVADMVWQDVLRRGLLVRCRLEDTTATLERATATWIEDDFRPVDAGDASALITGPIEDGMDDAAYAAAIAVTINAQRTAAYAYALANALRFRRGMLRQLLTTTILNKLMPSRS